MEMDYWRRSSKVSRLQHIRNEEIRLNMEIDKTIIDIIEEKRLRWYGHVQRMNNNRWPKRLMDWTPERRKNKGRPRKSWKDGVKEAMGRRDLSVGDWNDRKMWKLGIEKRCQP